MHQLLRMRLDFKDRKKLIDWGEAQRQKTSVGY